ncbi:MAG: DUF3267 domain-containing protein [Bacillota bacterium]|nr:DUF3267 domain-containing protein [Bacillota bacterium]
MSKESRKIKKAQEDRVRWENYQSQRQKLLVAGYREEKNTITVQRANAMALVTAAPFALALLVIYFIAWQELKLHITIGGLTLFLAAIFLSIPVHEGIHGLTWLCFCQGRFSSIGFGIMWDTFTPYCHCREPLNFWGYILGGLMPFLVLGLGVGILGIILKSGGLLWLGIFNILCAGGDTTICLFLRKYRRCLILDHPKECGFVAFIPPRDFGTAIGSER